MSKVLVFYNTFTRTSNPVELAGRLITANNINNSNPSTTGSFYICGPTVYSDSHVGHALTYIRADLIRRFMKSLFNVRLHTVMNITDIDDKILERTLKEYGTLEKIPTDPSLHPFNYISERYYKSFLNDMKSIRCLPADQYVKVSKHVNLITGFIQKLEQKGYAYITPDGDVRFKVSKLKNYTGRVDERIAANLSHVQNAENIDSRDFVLWKAAKPKEPVWVYNSCVNNNKCLPGRPGWHVQCSAISSAIFGNELDFHFGGKDLIFPHHYNEEACCCAYHSLDTSSTLHVWTNHWLHSGHLVLSNKKMSKSLENVVPISNFISRSSVNALRLLCVNTHYRSNLDFDEGLLDRLKALDHRINAFFSFLEERLQHVQENLTPQDSLVKCQHDNDMEQILVKTHEEIVDGVCDDFNLEKGLNSVLNLAKIIYSKDSNYLSPTTLTSAWYLLKEWCDCCALEYGHLDRSSSHNQSLIEIVTRFRHKIRKLTLDELKLQKDNTSIQVGTKILKDILKECDNVRSCMDEQGFVSRDRPV